MKRFLTIQDLVDEGFGCRQTIWRKMRAGEIPYIKVGHRVLIERDDFERYVADLHKRTDAARMG